MVAIYAPTSPALRRSDRFFYTGVGLYVLLLGLAGFAQTFYLKPWMGGHPHAPEFTLLIGLHATIFTIWMALAVSQPWLIAAGRYDLHRRYGPWAMALGALMIVVGIYTGAVAMDVGFRDAPTQAIRTGAFSSPFFSMVGFGFFLWLAWAARKSAEAHKRYIVLAHVNLLEAPAFRLLRTLEATVFPAILLLIFLPLMAAVAYDLATRHRVHPIYLWGGALSIALGFFRNSIREEPWWLSFARTVQGLT